MEEKTRGWTAGPWHVKDDWTPEGGLTVIANVDGEYDADGKPDCSYDTVLICEDDCGESLERSPHDAAFIAAANPQTILSLTQALRESMEREAGLLSRAGDLLEQIDTLEGVEFSRDFEPYEAEACWDDAVSRLRAALSAPGSEAVK